MSQDSIKNSSIHSIRVVLHRIRVPWHCLRPKFHVRSSTITGDFGCPDECDANSESTQSLFCLDKGSSGYVEEFLPMLEFSIGTTVRRRYTEHIRNKEHSAVSFVIFLNYIHPDYSNHKFRDRTGNLTRHLRFGVSGFWTKPYWCSNSSCNFDTKCANVIFALLVLSQLEAHFHFWECMAAKFDCVLFELVK